MFDNRMHRSVTALAVALALSFVVATSPAAASASTSQAVVRQPATVAGALTPEEAAGLTLMREEEKLARDVYQYLYQVWKLPVFSNIAASEQKHMDAVKTLLDRYQLADPAAGNAPGVFTDSHLQELYNELIAQGSQSTVEALQVGVAIETLDISDLQAQLALTTKPDITTVYQNLLKGSQNHLSAFTSSQGRRGR